MNDVNLKLWPFLEAKKLIKRLEDLGKKECILQTGYGPSGLPHIGTFGEVLRTSMVIKAFKRLSKVPTRLYVFSDDMDGLRKVPQNIPNKKMIEDNLDKPLSSIPDPFEKFKSFSEHNNFMLVEFLKKFDFNFEFKSATDHYKKGFFNSGLEAILDNYEKIIEVILPTLGKERKKTYSPFLPICRKSGRVLQVKVENIDKKKKRIFYINPFTKVKESSSIFDGECKLQWKVDWAMRWYVLDVDYEMNGKDLIESFILSKRINKIIGGKPPNNYTYELFLDENGEKISKSVGNGISVDDWLKFSPQESLELFMFQNPNRAKRLYFDVIPKMTDEYLRYRKDYDNLEIEKKLQNPLWFIDSDKDHKILENFSFNMILNLANVCNAETPDILWGFIENYYKNIDREDYPMVQILLEHGVNYYNKFVLPNKKYRPPNTIEKEGFKKLIKVLEDLNDDCEANDIQTKIYDIGMSLDFENLKDWFSAFYQVVLGQKEGPRLGTFIKFYGINKTIDLLKEKIN
ncbi:MAG: lysine--tRNA ligase [Pseudomonadota bacterium]|nr:lysine--tRNA ligase [Pseudomonadota bacterium]